MSSPAPAPQSVMKPGAFSMSFGSASSKGKAQPPPTRKPLPPFGGTGKPRLEEGESDDEGDGNGKVELVMAFDAKKGAISAEGGAGGKKPLVIPALKNKDWRQESMRRKTTIYLPPEALAGKNGANGGEGQEGDESHTETVGGNTGKDQAMKYGLRIVERKEEEMVVVERDGDVPMKDETLAPGPEKQKTEDELALEALLAGDDVKRKSNLVLAAADNADWREARARIALSEEDAYKADIATRPDIPTLEDYENVPVEEFGAALLRGMGWKEGMELGKRGGKAPKLKSVEKRPAFLGLGAKSQSVAEELGSWGRGDKKRKGWVDKTYTPVVLKNKVTGEIVDKIPEDTKGRKGDGDGRNGTGRELEVRERSRRDGDNDWDKCDTDQSDKRRRWNDSKDRRRERSRDRHRDHDRHRERDYGREYDRDRRDRDRDSRRDRDRERDRDRDYDRDRGSNRDRDRDGDRSRRRDDDWRRRSRDLGYNGR
ncbi:DExH-box splicing factor binding site-domain-containing protein [Kalaharituber pfeilii]|nr:DExH-box splicing factor binding site-domain-containing protein [Kalaharituber pfeilii]